MNINQTFFARTGFFALLIVIMFSSCVPMKRIKYLQQEVAKGDSLRTDFQTMKTIGYKIQPGDNLYINVNSAISNTDLFSKDDRSSNYYNDVGIYLNSYPVNDSGFIDFPLVGKIYLKDLTLEQAKDVIQAIVEDYLRGTTVVVRLANFQITFLGEINRPGEFSIYHNKFNIFDGIAMAGDMTTYARRDKVILIRETKTGTKVAHLNLNDISILESEYFLLMPQDIVYVPPVKGKNFAFANFPYALIFTTISTTLLLINYFSN